MLIAMLSRAHVALADRAAGAADRVMFWARVARESGVRGLVLSLRIHTAGRAIANTYEHIDAEVRQHEEQLRWLREELAKAKRAHAEAYAELRDLYASARPNHH